MLLITSDASNRHFEGFLSFDRISLSRSLNQHLTERNYWNFQSESTAIVNQNSIQITFRGVEPVNFKWIIRQLAEGNLERNHFNVSSWTDWNSLKASSIRNLDRLPHFLISFSLPSKLWILNEPIAFRRRWAFSEQLGSHYESDCCRIISNHLFAPERKESFQRIRPIRRVAEAFQATRSN